VSEASSKALPAVSVVIPIRRINDFLRENITHLKKLTFKNFEVVIVGDEKEDTSFVKDARFKFLYVGNISPGEKRNIGAREARGSILAFLDDDAFPQKNWLDQALKVFKDEDVYALGAPAVTPPDAGILERVSGRILESPLTSGFTVYRHVPRKRRLIDDYPSVNFLVRKEAFEAVGGFNQDFWPGEDTKICLDLIKHFERNFVYDPNPVVYHHRRNVFIPHLKQISRYGKHRGQFARIFPETSRVPSYFVPSLFVLGLFLGPLTFGLGWIGAVSLRAYTAVLSVYFILAFEESVRAAAKDKSLKMIPLFFVGIFLTHVVYGFNFLWGLLVRPKLKLRKVDKKTGTYLGG
jgi:cellulose synthase/poly-beta-1,6-N-acetylglucosamine synthase-like glycosyltransferase